MPSELTDRQPPDPRPGHNLAPFPVIASGPAGTNTRTPVSLPHRAVRGCLSSQRLRASVRDSLKAAAGDDHACGPCDRDPRPELSDSELVTLAVSEPSPPITKGSRPLARCDARRPWLLWWRDGLTPRQRCSRAVPAWSVAPRRRSRRRRSVRPLFGRRGTGA